MFAQVAVHPSWSYAESKRQTEDLRFNDLKNYCRNTFTLDKRYFNREARLSFLEEKGFYTTRTIGRSYLNYHGVQFSFFFNFCVPCSDIFTISYQPVLKNRELYLVAVC